MAESTGQTPSRVDLEASTFQRLHPRTYFERFIAEGFRPDGRKVDAWRDVRINVGDSTIVCGVKAEIAEPDLERPSEGFIVPNLDLPAICSPKFKPGPPAEEAQMLSEKISDILSSSNAIDPKTLCIHTGKAAWVIYVDAVCINYDGNILDATMLAVVAALQTVRLNLKGIKSFTISFGIFDRAHLISDPSSFEEPLLDAAITVTIDVSSGALGGINQVGFSAPSATLETITQRAITHSKIIAEALVQAKNTAY
ncbi:3' exoribonuclease family domain-containing protein [Rhizoctonia solani]|uniref:Ribosomal RNA-processing protein 43 n=1 Tax=Rhizoctonia solani TaxID=456999 RepID=A0A8H8NQD9_9AGAM|nr:3' exoribonuclease family domain-containing protein [Rhizoctonia solani]QRW16551.1 3' exoribonuclease family domain-containing protein [Rhizoctonia solani]